MLTRTQIEAARPQEKPVKLFDGRGLYLEIAPSGGRWWRFKYRLAGKERRVSLGVYPDVGLKEARERLEQARKLVAAGIDPSERRKAAKLALVTSSDNTFQAVGREWFKLNEPKWAPNHAVKVIDRLERDVFPWIGRRTVSEVSAPELLAVLRRIEKRGAIETAHRALQDCGRILRYAVATARANHDVSVNLRGALAPKLEKHFASVKEPSEVGALMRAIESYHGSFVTQCALRLAALTFVRPGELRAAEWREVNFETAEWRIPAARMKKRQPHIVPISSQGLAVLSELQPLTGDGKYVFPSERTRERPMSENTVNAALRRMGYTNDEMTGHGFRSMASTLLNEQGWNRDAIERQLAHAEQNETRSAYNYAEFLPERRKMIQAWADFLDGLARSQQNPNLDTAKAA
ncbi:MAG: integrase arm-type DNA-binding domain-containing protein [Steroidobacteraceae bacterium]